MPTLLGPFATDAALPAVPAVRRLTAAATLVSTAALLACASVGPVGSSAPGGADELSASPDADGRTLETLFAGRFPGVTVSRASDGGLEIRIRGGSNSFFLSDQPLYVVDETPIPVGARGISFLNPYDIATIQVLKNPADIALYGIRGANGVVKITTRRPGQR